jgi:hypothetical protein
MIAGVAPAMAGLLAAALRLPDGRSCHGDDGGDCDEKTISAQLLFADFVKRLAVDAEIRGGAGFETFHPDLDTADFTVTVITGVDALDGLVDFLDELALAVA